MSVSVALVLIDNELSVSGFLTLILNFLIFFWGAWAGTAAAGAGGGWLLLAAALAE